MVDVFADVLHDWESVNRIQQWILSSKQGTAWHSDMATASAVGALLRKDNIDNSKLLVYKPATLTLNGQQVDTGHTDINLSEYRLSDASAAHPAALNFELSNSTPFPVWGAVFFSYEAPVDSIMYNGTGILLPKSRSSWGSSVITSAFFTITTSKYSLAKSVPSSTRDSLPI